MPAHTEVRTKWSTSCRRQMHFITRKYLYLFIKISRNCPCALNWQCINIVSGNGMAPIRRQPTSHFLNQCWSSVMTPYVCCPVVTKPHRGRKHHQVVNRSVHLFSLWTYFHLDETIFVYRITWWRPHMEAFFTLLALCAGKSPVAGDFSSQRATNVSFDVSLIRVRMSC